MCMCGSLPMYCQYIQYCSCYNISNALFILGKGKSDPQHKWSGGANDCKNLSVEHRVENLIFSNSRKDVVSHSHDFFPIKLRANREVNKITFVCFTDILMPASGIPNIAICGDGSTTCSNITEIILKWDVQYSPSLGHDQNIWVSLQGACKHLSQVSVKFGYIMASLFAIVCPVNYFELYELGFAEQAEQDFIPSSASVHQSSGAKFCFPFCLNPL